MIHFLRRIRHTLLRQGKLKTYAAYAIGEILLVVIGILIAFRINVWNENRVERRLEKSTLIELRQSLISDIEIFQGQINAQKHLAKVTHDLLTHLRADKPYSTRLDTMWERSIRYYLLNFNNSAFELLESRGIDLISNVALRNALVKHYNLDQTTMQDRLLVNERLSDVFLTYSFDRLYNPITEDFEESFNYENEVLIPVDYNVLRGDEVYLAKLSHSIKTRYRLSNMVKEYIVKQEKLLTAIDEELTRPIFQ